MTKNLHSYFAAVLVLLGLAACASPAAQYTDAEAPKQLTIDNASMTVPIHFAPRSSRIYAGDAALLHRLAATGQVGSADRVTVSVAGPPSLVDARFNSISRELVGYGIAPSLVTVGGLPPDQAILVTGHYVVTLPPCPNWSKQDHLGFTNTASSNFGCANAVDLGRMVWRPADLAQGVPHGANYIVGPNVNEPRTVFSAGATPVPGVPGSYSTSAAALATATDVTGCASPLPPPPNGGSGVTLPTTSQVQSCTIITPQ